MNPCAADGANFSSYTNEGGWGGVGRGEEAREEKKTTLPSPLIN